MRELTKDIVGGSNLFCRGDVVRVLGALRRAAQEGLASYYECAAMTAARGATRIFVPQITEELQDLMELLCAIESRNSTTTKSEPSEKISSSTESAPESCDSISLGSTAN